MVKNMITVIVPVFNVESYLKQCLDSIINQSYQNLQIILVDDGSTDSSGRICDEYAEKDSRIEVIHKSNCGAALARNTGIESIKGEYVYFVDSDDYLNLDCFNIMLNNIKNADIVQCREYIFNHKVITKTESIPNGVFDNISFMKIYLDNWSCSLIHNKLFRTEIIKDKFKGGKVIDDEYFTYKCILNAKKINVIGDSLYYYRIRKSSLMRNKETVKFQNIDRVDYLYKRYLDLIAYPDLKTKALTNIIDSYQFILKDHYISVKLIYSIKIKMLKILFECKNVEMIHSIIHTILKPTYLYIKNKNLISGENEDEFYE